MLYLHVITCSEHKKGLDLNRENLQPHKTATFFKNLRT